MLDDFGADRLLYSTRDEAIADVILPTLIMDDGTDVSDE